MVARIKTGKTMRGVLSYNENKVNSGDAACIAAVNFGKDPRELSFHERLNRFQNLMRWNKKVSTNTLHISLNFDPSEKLSPDTLSQVASSYMTRIGFGNQPYLVYQHFDAGHPHIHIATTNIASNGKAISLHNLGRLRSEPARKAVEKEFNLVQASSRSKKIQSTVTVIAEYGKAETKRTITNAVGLIATSYRYTSLPELNAALKQYNIIAHRGNENSLTFKKGGLLYSFVDKDGKPKGVAIKASSLHFKPTLKYIEKQFRLNEALRQVSRQNLVQRINNALANKPTLDEFNIRLRKEQVFMVLRHAKDNRVFGITFVDNKTKAVFNGSDLHKELSANNLLAKLRGKNYETDEAVLPEKHAHKTDQAELLTSLITLPQAEDPFVMPTPAAFRKKKKKRNSQRRQ